MDHVARAIVMHARFYDRGNLYFSNIMAIMFKKTAVMLFLLSHHVLASNSSDFAIETGKRKSDALGMSLRDRETIKKTEKILCSSGKPESESIEKSKPRRIVRKSNSTRTQKKIPKKSPLGVTESLTPLTADSLAFLSSSPDSDINLSDESNVVLASDWDNFALFNDDDEHANGHVEEHVDEPVQELNEEFLIGNLIQSVKEGRLDSVRGIYSQFPEIFNSINDISEYLGSLSPFMYAVCTENRPMVEFLLSTGIVDPNATATADIGVLTMVIEVFGDAGLVRDLLTSGSVKILTEPAFRALFNLNNKKSDRFLPIVDVMASLKQLPIISALIVLAKDAVCADDVDLVRFLDSRGVPMRYKYKNNMSFIHYAAARGNSVMVNLLLDIGVPIDALSGITGISALQIAFYDKNYDLVRFLIQKGARAGLEEVIGLAIEGSVRDVFNTFIFTAGDLSNFVLPGGYNLLTFCIEMDRPEFLAICLYRLLYPIDTFTPDQEGRTIYRMDLPENASADLRSIVEIYRDSFLTRNEFDVISEILN